MVTASLGVIVILWAVADMGSWWTMTMTWGTVSFPALVVSRWWGVRVMYSTPVGALYDGNGFALDQIYTVSFRTYLTSASPSLAIGVGISQFLFDPKKSLWQNSWLAGFTSWFHATNTDLPRAQVQLSRMTASRLPSQISTGTCNPSFASLTCSILLDKLSSWHKAGRCFLINGRTRITYRMALNLPPPWQILFIQTLGKYKAIWELPQS